MTLSPAAPPTAIDLCVDQVDSQVELELEVGELWWGGSVDDGVQMPYGREPFLRDLATVAPRGTDPEPPSNQSAPLLLSTTGRTVWSERPFTFEFTDGRLCVAGRDIQVARAGASLREAYLGASRAYFPPSGQIPARELFSGPQYNTWIETPHTPTQESVLAFARSLLDAGLPPGVIMIDDNWAPDYGTWVFDAGRFPDPGAMLHELHGLGYSVMVWLVPWVSPDSATFRDLESRGLLVRDATGETAVRRWWNGFSALLDMSNEATVAWLCEQLDALVALGVDGFKFDGGDVRDYRADDRAATPSEPVDQCEAWARLGLRYPFNEFRACWRMAGQPIGQRLQDKPPAWGSRGIGSLLPELLAQSMLGHAFTCPDMIGGGEITAMQAAGGVDQEFFVRYAQVAALAPMMQFSVSPARVLDATHLAAVRSALAVREELLPTLLDLVEAAAVTGEPVVRPMAYHAPELATITDQFFLGPDLIVAPVLTQGAVERAVALPAGTWRSDDGSVVEGPAHLVLTAPLDRIPRFVRLAG